MRKIKNFVSHFFIVSTVFLTFVSIYAIWVEDAGDLLAKTAGSIGLMFLVSLVVLVASRYMHSDEELKALESDESLELKSLELFKRIRKTTVSVLIGSSTLLGFVGVLSIWDIISDQSVIKKVLSSLSCIVFSAVVVVVVCILRSRKETFKGRDEQDSLKVPVKEKDPNELWKWVIGFFVFIMLLGLMDTMVKGR